MKELEDYTWFPEFLRRHQMEFLSLMAKTFGLYTPATSLIQENLKAYACEEWTDLCSGSGGPVLSILPKVSPAVQVMLSDLFPPQLITELPEKVRYLSSPNNVLEDSLPGAGLLTMFNSFHHFETKEQAKILHKISQSGRPVVIAEILNPGFLCFFQVLLSTTLGHWLLVPFMKPFSIKRLLFTYLIPIHTLTVLIDGLISVAKSLSKKKMIQLSQQHSTSQYQYHFEKIPGVFSPLYVLKGFPVQH